jgi:hypothetical protein
VTKSRRVWMKVKTVLRVIPQKHRRNGQIRTIQSKCPQNGLEKFLEKTCCQGASQYAKHETLGSVVSEYCSQYINKLVYFLQAILSITHRRAPCRRMFPLKSQNCSGLDWMAVHLANSKGTCHWMETLHC